MKTIILFSGLTWLSAILLNAQGNNASTETVKVFGNCAMCKTNIEKAGTKKGIYKTAWDANTQMATITYNSSKATPDDVLKSIALSGYDNDTYLAPDEAYNKLEECCKYKRENKQMMKKEMEHSMDHTMPAMQEHSDHKMESKENAAQQTSQLNRVFDHYFALKDALVKTEAAQASTHASAMLEALKEVDMGKLKMEEHNVWMKVEKDLKTDAQQIKDRKTINNQREYFMSLSKNMYELIKVAAPSNTVYYQFCPMANNGKGANWLSKEQAIKNPYYGSMMMTCGNIVETISK
ncbi:MAG: DUF3347 domain-containing protein [Chitinophagaceae bacterium]